ncbi:hypothetical protein [Actinoplanes sp. L3-i22]|uniref:hypothetical protein n=1 Tax=Actinoplanes sp. L3-i22 TaxID=2836373 RepID=UPI001C75B420|nr:hypothetical protein [Actinoplanes sp. L3-i22]BCY11115.1 hypothetical protein L3i22_062030 [Actinoplanes sp. L3-i22]
MGHDDPDDQQEYAGDGEESDIDRSSSGFSPKDGYVDPEIFPSEEAGDHPQERDDRIAEIQSNPKEATLLSFIISELPAVERECAVLLDSEAAGRHEAAARAVLKALLVGVRRIRQLNLPLPAYTETAVTAAQARSFLEKVGTLLNGAVREMGMEWPPPLLHPPPAVTRDLNSLYDLATIGSLRRDRSPDESFLAALQLIDKKTTELLAGSEERRIRGAKAAAASLPGTTRSRVGMFLSGSAVLIGLLQGPGAAHDFYQDSLTLGGDIRDIALHIVSGVSDSWSRTVTEISNVIDPSFQQDIQDGPLPESRNDRGGFEGVAESENNMEAIFATLDQLVALLPTESLEQANERVNSAIAGLQVIEGSVGHDAVSGAGQNALYRILAAQEAVDTLREQIEIWKEQRGGHRLH